MNKRIIYPNDDGGVSIIIPTPDFMENHTIDDVIAQSLPQGKPYKIIDESDIPSDRTFRDAWEYEE